MGIADFILGKYLLSTPKRNAAKVTELCMKHKIAYKKPRFCDGNFCIVCGKSDCAVLEKACEVRKIDVDIRALMGIPSLLSQYKRRVGLAVGAIFAVLVVVWGLNVVWHVDVTGNELVSTESIKALLSEKGLSEGSYIGGADLTALENNVMLENPEIAWISININGTVAHVEVRESRKGVEKSDRPANLVAARDGKIERIEAYNGSCAVKVGDVVRAGDLLVSGIYDDGDGKYRLTRAEGRILARTLREFSVEIPFENEQKSYVGRNFYEISIKFFKKSIKVFTNSGKMPPTCDIIYKNGKVGLKSLPKIPIGYEMTRYLQYEYKPITLDECEAAQRAFDALENELSRISEDSEIMEKNIEFEISDRAYILKCRIVCIEDIARIREIE